MSNMERKYDFTKEQYIAKINEIMQRVDWLWLLDQLYRFALNMVKGTEYEIEESEV